MREIIKMIVVLSTICVISGFALSSLKKLTAPQIELQVLTYVQGPAIKDVLSGYDNDPIADRRRFTDPSTGAEYNVFPAKKGGKLFAVALENFGGGYGGDIGVMVGFDVENDVLTGIGVTTMKETPGLGTVIAEDSFTSKFTGKGLDVALKSDGGEIDGISGATFSSIGCMVAVQKASAVYKSLKSEIVTGFN
ncbi:NADH:quinone oxidoreductase subunit RnfG [Oleidesulfovibrio alaskensis G20]|jgi:electron transport complex protein RnfG|uniref:Ion-translocating oxidoreductase complex subunit G n=1 Tax=Oleidesulfovibrio alaskensis (strain ATCC BAA-1058 / DSM 17464 / G20) TaxID=207559 RepID=Q315L2_OLEA2|nr:FMN-binding protein [Oleidesulfovibrio alaskensis]ABB37384.1 NADH:quinone oxidoreductase subunit RnfG [Oleidesulfovibrio alaskensis G20]MBG0774254.1 FMN-binding protein [Oleidesulfovibrio alaskensis]MBL3583152.1 FMN-binding protein [Oleidesulfovibrio alaskensis]